MAAAPVVTHFSQCTQNFFRKRISSKVISHPPVQSIKVRSQMMPPEVKKYLSRNIQSQFDKDPAIQSGEVKNWLLSGNQPFDLSTIKSNTLSPTRGRLPRWLTCGLLSRSGPSWRRKWCRQPQETKPSWREWSPDLGGRLTRTRRWFGTLSPPSPSDSRLSLTLTGDRLRRRTTSQMYLIYVSIETYKVN